MITVGNEEPWRGAWAPQPGPQVEAIAATWCQELFYGGAAGGGKSDYLLGDFLQDVATYGEAWQGILFRRTYGELSALVERSHQLYPQTGARWNEQKHRWLWPNGAQLKFRYLEQDRHKSRYQGHAYTWIGWDELTQWASDGAYRYLRARLRSAHQVPTKRIRSAANPGGVGHHWVKARFVTPARGGFVPLVDPETGHDVMFVPAKLDQNQILLKNDPGYRGNLKGLGSDALVKAWLDGDWDVVEGAFFDCWSARVIVRPFTLPKAWMRFRSADWGSASPFSVGWWAVVQDDAHTSDGDLLPRGALVRYREWYGTKNPATFGKGLKLTAEQVGDGIARLEKNDPRLTYGVLDPSTFREDGGPSIAERVNNRLIAAKLSPFREADNTRVSAQQSKDRRGPMSGWDQMRARIIGTQDLTKKNDDGRPMVFCFDTCTASIRTIPMLQHDTARPEDLDTNSEDHAADDWRYGCSSRPWLISKAEAPEPRDGYRSAGGDDDDNYGDGGSLKTL